jgi:hypothetical protein
MLKHGAQSDETTPAYNKTVYGASVVSIERSVSDLSRSFQRRHASAKTHVVLLGAGSRMPAWVRKSRRNCNHGDPDPPQTAQLSSVLKEQAVLW